MHGFILLASVCDVLIYVISCLSTCLRDGMISLFFNSALDWETCGNVIVLVKLYEFFRNQNLINM